MMIRKIPAILVLILLLCCMAIPAGGADGNSGSSGSDGAGSGGDGGTSGNGSPGPEGPGAQILREEQERSQQENVDQPGVRITQQDRDQTQGRTGIGSEGESVAADPARQRDRDTFLQQIADQQQNLSPDRDQAWVDLAFSALSLSGNVSGNAGPDLARLGAEVNTSYDDALRAEQRIATRNSFTRMLFGGDRETAGLLIRYAEENQQRIREMEQLLVNCSDCDPQVRMTLEQQLQVLSQEQNRLLVFGQQELGDRGLFGWLFR